MNFADLKIYWKFLSRNKLYSFVSIFGFSVALMFVIILSFYVKKQLSYDDFQEKRDRIFILTHDSETGFGNTVAPFVKDKCPEVENYVRMYGRTVSIGQKGSEKIQAKALLADSSFFNVFSFKLIEGDPSQVLAAHKTVVVSQSFANKIFPDKNPIGNSLYINNIEHTVTGLMEDMPDNTMLPDGDLIVNYRTLIDFWGGEWIINTSNNFGFTTFLLEKEGTDLTLKTPMLLELFKKEFWFYKNGFTSDLKLIPIKDAYFEISASGYDDLKKQSKTQIMIYSAIAILILVIALLNYINLTVAQAAFRGKEAAIKKLLGCNRGAIIRQLLIESLIMTSFTLIIGFLLAIASEPFFNNVLEVELNIIGQLTISIIGIAILFVILISLLAGLLPALIISGFNPIEIVKGTFSRKVKSSYAKGLIIFQYTVVIILLVCSFFMRQQSDFMINYNMGFNREGILEMDNMLDSAQLVGFKSKLYSIPGVELVSYTCGTPLNGGNNFSYEKDGEQFSFQELVVDSAFFKIYGINIEPTNIDASDQTYFLNRKAYNALHPDSKTQMVDMGTKEKYAIAGIISDFNIRTLHNETGLVRIRKLRSKDWVWNIVVKISGSGADLYKTADRIKEEYSKYNGGELFESRFVDDIIHDNYKKEEKSTIIMSAFSVLTIIIMIMGVFAMSLYIIKQKEKEIGIRKVNGATEYEILMMLNKDSLIRVLIAFAIAAPIAYYGMNKWLENFAYRIELNFLVFIGGGLIVLFLTLVSISWMTWKAAQANPVDILKAE